MTSYSVLRSTQRATIIATWPGAWSDHSANITTSGDIEQASYLAAVLTRLSEDAWDAAAFLDASPALELGISALIQQLRSGLSVAGMRRGWWHSPRSRHHAR